MEHTNLSPASPMSDDLTTTPPPSGFCSAAHRPRLKQQPSIDSNTPQQAVQALPSPVASLSALTAGSLELPRRS
ncbi:hypothetical protein PtrSN002B_000581 [Pyrenophora tritici-repentis]|uniref:Uncharacterized protein n=1 Tax=Pyrenophora tritici-repentis TaxID=45151 RepID=A0A2W1EQB9_9PLEO|nr:hypothetical protein Alg215_02093 [Pyrenophora tritici-repentis]KAI0591967.1 hypothetical protein Alg130_00704 [Pyrenophora tritici-repentis]KAI0627728.1 hypothetical protein TUN199_00263 [Pyrenophora tritici-repentis]KAI1519332.1 hypothetical protein Ptr86124_002460 [Pyrenophora tritici-repentis]KAI1549152.1 hypothetical protein PtrSN001A_000922 [Pyrenophora tritici-repentis]